MTKAKPCPCGASRWDPKIAAYVQTGYHATKDGIVRSDGQPEGRPRRPNGTTKKLPPNFLKAMDRERRAVAAHLRRITVHDPNDPTQVMMALLEAYRRAGHKTAKGR